MSDMSGKFPVNPNIKPGIYQGIPNESYHAGPGVSKSGLWTICTKTPAHYKFGVRKDTNHFDFGEGCHLAILQPDLFEKQVMRGPEDRRGNKWKDAAEFCAGEGKLLLTGPDYDEVLTIRDAVHADAWINNIITGGPRMVEASGYWTDPETGQLCRCRPDLYREDLGIIVDVKSTASAHPDAFARSVVNYGYHAQEAFYTDGWNHCLAAQRSADVIRQETSDNPRMETKGTAPGGVQGFVFLAWEKEPPYAYAVYELPPSIVEEGRAMMRRALTMHSECTRLGEWPAYGQGVHELEFQRWAYRYTDAPNALDEVVG